jgi:hypothetical protein
MNDADLAAVRQLVLGAFRWVDGHADLSRVFGSADVLRVVETGSQAAAVQTLIARCGARAVGVAALVDDCTNETRRRLNLRGLLRSADLCAAEPGASQRSQPDR